MINLTNQLIYILFGILIMRAFFILNKRWVQSPGEILINKQIIILINKVIIYIKLTEKTNSDFIQRLYINYAIGYFKALLNIASKYQIERVANIDVYRLILLLENISQRNIKKIMKSCPEFVMSDEYFIQLGLL